MEEKWNKTETSAPLYRAYSVYENPKQSYDQRMDQFPGPGSPMIQTSMQSNGFVGYANSGGISRKEHLKSEINTIAERIARAKEIKGVLCLNNRKANFGSFKTPALDLALQNRSGLNGGETNMRFYMKFPIYRPRGHGPPDVDDDLDAIWKEQLDLTKTGSNFFTTDVPYKKRKQPGPLDNEKMFYSTQDGAFRYDKASRRSNSLAGDVKLRETSVDTGRSLKLAGRNTITFPKRERFNENSQEVIQEQRDMKKSGSKLRLGPGAVLPADQASKRSQRSLTKSELSRFFRDGTKKVEDDLKSRLSEISKGASLRNRLARKAELSREGEPKEKTADEPGEPVVEEITYESEKSEQGDEEAQGADAATVATTALDNLSVAPTELLAAEYKKLMDQYDAEVTNRK